MKKAYSLFHFPEITMVIILLTRLSSMLLNKLQQMDNLENQAKAEALYQQLKVSPTFSEQTPNIYEKCLEFNPNHIPALFDVGCIYDGDKDYEGNGSYWFEMKCANQERAIDCFTRIIQLDPKFSQAYLRLARIYRRSNKERSLQYYLQYINLKPQDYCAIVQLGEIYHLLHKNQEALVYFTKCVKFLQRDQRAQHGLAKIYIGEENFKDALQCLKKCKDPKNAETYALYGRVYHKMGNAKGAIHSYRKCKQLKYDHKQALAYLDKHLKAYLDSQLAMNQKWH